ncbi:MAG: phosphatase PAP2 family protein [Candidatus Gracilibacteria bacterium]|nr:phosphatase PAP2 family protein [Candidatus Gracilibacteria bacterium]
MLQSLSDSLNYYWTGLVFLPLVLLLTFYQLKNKKKWFLFWSSFVFMQALVWILKFAVASQRPLGVHMLKNPSFPSGVAADAGFFAMYLSFLYPKYWILWHSFGICVSLLRVYSGAHYVIDIVFGYLLGICLVLLAQRLFKFVS